MRAPWWTGVVWMCLGLAAPAMADDRGTTAADFLKIGLGAGPAGMGEAVTARTGMADGVFYNPAGLLDLERIVLSATHINWIAETRYEALAYARPLPGIGTVGAAVYVLHMPDIPALNGSGEDEGTVQAYDLGVQCSYAREAGAWLGLPGLGAGATLKLLHRELAGVSASGAACDLGAVYALEDGWRFGVACQNIGYLSPFGGASESLPLTLRLGGGFVWSPAEGHRLDLGADLVQPSDHPLKGAVGLEYAFGEWIVVRAGYKLGAASDGVQAGAGVRMQGLNLDYALKTMGPFGLAHMVSASIGFGESVRDLQQRRSGQLLRDAEMHYTHSRYPEALNAVEEALALHAENRDARLLRDKLKTVLQLLTLPAGEPSEPATPVPDDLSPDQREEMGLEPGEEERP